MLPPELELERCRMTLAEHESAMAAFITGFWAGDASAGSGSRDEDFTPPRQLGAGTPAKTPAKTQLRFDLCVSLSADSAWSFCPHKPSAEHSQQSSHISYSE